MDRARVCLPGQVQREDKNEEKNKQGGETGVILLLIDRAVSGERSERTRKRER